jgi:hypothetical protein
MPTDPLLRIPHLYHFTDMVKIQNKRVGRAVLDG